MRARLVLVLLALGSATLARADGPVLHEYVPEPGPDEATSLVSAGDGSGPRAIVYDGEVLPEPEDGPLQQDEQPMRAPRAPETPGSDAAAPQGGPSFRPDRVTDLEDTLGYYTVFTPTVAPFKRVTALDRVALAQDGETPVLRVSDTARDEVPVVGADAEPPDDRPRDRFWGSVVLDFSGGRRVPFPSVSPGARILRLRTKPPSVRVRIEKDGADNFFAVAEGSVPSGEVRVIFLTDAPRPYFNAPVPDVASDALAGDVPPMPESVRRRAQRFAGELGLTPRDPLPKVMRVLTRHFRAFEESEQRPENHGDIYLDLARAQKGVCRHRAYAFVITAQGLGIPARFVYNEAHSWAEVKMPDVGWMRVDLGGAAHGLEAHNGSDRPVYEPPEPDPLPQPEPYRESYSQLGNNVQGLRNDRGHSGRSGAASGGSDSEGAGSAREGDGSGSASGAPSPGEGSTRTASGPDRSERGPEPVTLTVERRRYQVFRGRTLEVHGRATGAGGKGIEGLRIEALLRGDREQLLGVTVTREHGWFQGSFGVPPDIDVGSYELIVRTPGDAEHAAATAR